MKNIIHNYKNLKILITGNTGFKGTWLSHWLLRMGAKVIGIGLSPEKDSILYKELNLKRRVKQYIIDIKKFDKVDQIVKKEKPDLIFHLAAQSIVSSSYKDPLKTFQSNILGSANLLEAFRKNNIPSMVYITSDKCYLNLDLKKDYKESDELGGLDNYSSSKASAEIIFSSYFHSYFKNKNKHLSLATARAGNVIGGGDMKVNRLIPDIVKSIKNNKKILIRNPYSTRPWQHVFDCLNGYLNTTIYCDKNNIQFSNWNFSPSYKSMTVEKIIYLLISKKLINKDKVLLVKNFIKESLYLNLSNKKVIKLTNWKNKFNFNQTVIETINFYKEIENNKKNLSSLLNSIQNKINNFFY